MSPDNVQQFWIFSVFVVMLLTAGFYCILFTNNFMRTLIGLELLTKAVTLFIIVVGHVIGRVGLAQAMVITLIVIEVVVIVVAAGVMLNVYNCNESLNTQKLRNLKG